MSRTAIYLLVFLSLIQVTGCNAQSRNRSEQELKEKLGIPDWALPPLRTTTIQIKDVTAEVELAFTPEEVTQGLMYRTSMEEDHGMLFVYRQPQFLSFWMKNTHLPLSIAFIRMDGSIDIIRDMEPLDTGPRYRSTYRCQFALEMNQGWFEDHGIEAGDRVVIPKEVKAFLRGDSADVGKWENR